MAQPRNIQERTFEFAVRVVKLVDRLPRTTSGMQLGRQLVASSTSIGANMQEADGAETKKDFIHKTGVSLKEAKESHFWLRDVDAALLQNDREVKSMVQEARELSLIIAAIKRNAVKGKNNTD